MSTYQVQSGDSLWKITSNAYKDKGLNDSQIARKVEELSIFNNISNPSNISVNQVLDLSCFDDLAQEQEPVQTEAKAEDKQDKTKEQDKEEQKLPENKYTIQSGDSLWKITKKYYSDISDNEIAAKVNELANFNNISNPSNISVNQVLDLSCFDDLTTENQDSQEEIKEEAQEELKEQPEEQTEQQQQEEVQEQQAPQEINHDDAMGEMYQTPTTQAGNLKREINFKEGNPEDLQYSSEAVKEKTLELYNASQNNALDKNAKHRNAPTVIEENGALKVEANQEFYESGVQGPLSGLTVMVNSGHGGYDAGGNQFDPGACVGQAEEWIINQDYAEELAEQLLLQGADVLMTQGYYQTVADMIPEFAEEYGDGKNNDNLKMVSIHANANANTDARGICYYWSDNNSESNTDNDLPQALRNAAENEGLNINYSSAHQVKILSTANAQNIDNVLVELGFMTNPQDLDLLLNSDEYKESMIDSIVQGLIADA